MTAREEAIVVGIDIGTSGVRAVAMAPDFSVLASGAAKLSEFSPDHRDPAVWRQAMRAALGRLFGSFADGNVVAVSIDGTSGTLLPVDAAGMPLAPPMMYNDPVTELAVLEAITAHAPRDSAAHGATSGLAKAISFQPLPDVHRVLHQADWLSGLLTGHFGISDENNALKTGYDPIARRWPDWIADTGARTDLLPQVRPAGEPVGTVTKAASAEFGLPEGAAVVAGTTDGCASFLATGAGRPGDGVSALGTTLTVKMLSDKPLFAPEYGLYSHRIGDMWLAGGASNTGGIVLSQYFGNEEIARLSARLDPTVETGLDYYPLAKPGERFPINDPALAPRMSPRPQSDEDFLKALFEGIASVEALAYARLAELGAPKLACVRSVGGGAANEAWKVIRTRRLGVPFPPVLSEEAAAGAARLALSGAEKAGLL
ncbi:MAG: FGGY-family carbohydrate kinase [Shinella sp.]|nr:FGGY-family carbohydrate kinase [Shinella sp.]